MTNVVATVERVAGRRAPVAAVAAGLRIRQWTKNLLLFAGLLFAARIGDGTRWGEAFLAFAAFCAASSAAYLVNDVLDADLDRRHPAKRSRPVASGRISARTALVVSAALAAVALAAGGVLGLAPFVFVAVFLGLQLAYSLGLKTIVGVDVLMIAGLFTIRAAAGAEAVEVPVSPWLLACTALLALFLALAKRRGELAAGGGARQVLSRYSLAVLDRLLVADAAATVAAYCLYAVSAGHSFDMAVTIPFVVAAIGRYFVLIHRDGLGEAPDEILLSDVPLLALIGCWIVSAAVVLAAT